MSTELATMDALGMSLAEAIGVSVGAGVERKSAYIPRIKLKHTGIMGSMDVGGKKIKTEVVPAGAYEVTLGEDDVVYTANPTIRIFAVRQQWSKWNSEDNIMMKTVMVTDLKGDLKDNMGGFNLGRPSGYIEDWNALPDKTKDLIRSIKRNKIVFGMIHATDATDAEGNPVEKLLEPTPFVFNLAPSSIKPFDTAMAALKRKNLLPIQYAFSMSSTEAELPNGNAYYMVDLKGGQKVDYTPEDQTTLKDFIEYINYNNEYILQQWEEKNQEGISSEDADIVHQFVNVEEAD